MHRGTLNRAVNLLLLVSVVFVTGTGWLVDRLDLNEFRLHPRAGYVMSVLVAVHVGLHWRSLIGRRQHPHHRSPVVEMPERRATRSAEVGEAEPSPPGPTAAAGSTRRTVLAAGVSGAAGLVGGWWARSELGPRPYDGGDVGLFYHRESSLGVRALVSNLLDWGRRPARYKQVPDADVVPLPSFAPAPTMGLAQALDQRRSIRTYADRAVTAEELAWLVHAGTGITAGDEKRTAPSAGALYPIETYVAVNRVEGIDDGLYHVDVRDQALEVVRSGSVGGDLLIAGMGQEFLRDASVVFVLTGYFQRTRWKYHQRHYRYVCWEAGHIAQNLCLAGEAAGLGCCVVGAFLDGRMNDLLRIDGRQEAALGLVAVGPR